jgi:hypothetical protein
MLSDKNIFLNLIIQHIFFFAIEKSYPQVKKINYFFFIKIFMKKINLLNYFLIF